MRSALCLCAALCAAFAVHGLEMTRRGRDVILTTARMTVTVRDARLVRLTVRRDGFVLADSAKDAPSDVAGMGTMTGKEDLLSRYHGYITEQNQPSRLLIKPGRTPLYRRPGGRSRLSAAMKDGAAVLTWTGLEDGKDFHPEDVITIRFREDPAGALVFSGTGESNGKGVFSLQIPIDNLIPSGRFILPVYGGLEYSAGRGPELVMGFIHAMDFYQAPVMTFEAGKHALGLWCEDATFRQFFAFLQRRKGGASFSFEFPNLMPFDALRTAATNEMKLDVFPDAGYLAAAAPYRAWYRSTFAKEISRRDGTWAKNIGAVVNNSTSGLRHSTNPEELIEICGKENILFMFYGLRKPPFDVDLPDHTPRPVVLKGIAELHRLGVRVMGYCVPFCVNKNSPLFKRDHLEKITLTKRHRIDNYRNFRDRGGEKWDNIPDKKLIYLDPLLPAWRSYIVKNHADMLKASGLDALYEDTLGAGFDHGNGVIDGISGPMGSTVMAKELKKALRVPFATEYGPAFIAFASNWALIQSKRRPISNYLLHHRHPLAAYLFGYRVWAFPTLNATGPAGDFEKHLAVSSAGALCGIGHFSFGPYLYLPGRYTMKSGFRDLCNLQAALFCRLGLVPYFPAGRFPEGVVSMFTDRQNRQYRFCDDGFLQQLCGPDGRALYGCLDGRDSLEHGDLTVPGWPVVEKGRPVSLDPRSRYALYPGKDTGTVLKVGRLPAKVRLKNYRETEELLVLELESADPAVKACDITIALSPDWPELLINGRKSPRREGTLRIGLPGQLVAFKKAQDTGKTVSLIASGTGLKVGERRFPSEVRRRFAGETMYQIDAGEIKYLDRLVEVKSADAVFEFSYIYPRTGTRLSNASKVSVEVNGVRVGEEFAAARANPPRVMPRYVYDNRKTTFRVPLGEFAGKSVLVSVRIDDCGNGYDDLQFLSVPRIVGGAQRWSMTACEQ